MTILDREVTLSPRHETRPAIRPATRSVTLASTLTRAAGELALVGVLFLLYDFGRTMIRGRDAIALDHGVDVHRLEAALGFPSEAGLQRAVSAIPDFFELANRYYVGVHFPLTITFLVWGFVACTRADYTWARNLLIVQTFLALLIHLLFPLAPPRMFAQFGFVDTMTVYGPSAYGGASAAVANQFAAMPSLHIGRALLIAVVVSRTGPRWLAVLAGTHAALTVLVVVTTANHWWLVGIVAAALLGLALLIFPGPGRHRSWTSTLVKRPVASNHGSTHALLETSMQQASDDEKEHRMNAAEQSTTLGRAKR